jgi:hypothetical protein
MALRQKRIDPLRLRSREQADADRPGRRGPVPPEIDELPPLAKLVGAGDCGARDSSALASAANASNERKMRLR